MSRKYTFLLHFCNFFQNEIYTLRKQLKYMNAYLMTCNAGGSKTKEAFSRYIWNLIPLNWT